jgi:hypothetical protein
MRVSGCENGTESRLIRAARPGRRFCSPSVTLHRFTISDANALRISDSEIPNCRAILEGVMPALKAAFDPSIVAAGVAKGQRSRRLDSLAGEIR